MIIMMIDSDTQTPRVTPQARRAMRRLIQAVDRTIAAARDAERARDALNHAIGVDERGEIRRSDEG